MWIRLLIILNKKCSKRHGWKPYWFYVYGFNGKLIKRIKRFQKKADLLPSGICGKKTHRLILLKRLLDIKKRKD